MITLRLVSEKKSFASFIIRRVTYSPFSHVDVVMPDGTLLGARMSGGVQARPANYAKFDTVALFTIQLPADDEAKFYAFLHAQLGKPYDKSGIANLAIQNRNWHDDDSWFCSELVAAAFEHAGHPLVIVPNADRVTPRDVSISPLLKQIS